MLPSFSLSLTIKVLTIARIPHIVSSDKVRRFPVAHFLIALVALLAVTPFVVELANGDFLEAVLITGVLLTAVPAVGARRRSFVTAIVLVIPALLGTWLHQTQPDIVPRGTGLIAAIVFALFVIFHLFAFILRAERVNSEVLCAAVATYLMLGVMWAMAYELVWRISPESFEVTPTATGERTVDGFEALYFSFGTLAPINDNDIVPISNLARMLVMIEAIVGMLFMGMLIARLVGIYSTEEAAEQRNELEAANAQRDQLAK